MKTLQKIAALTIVAGGFVVAGMTSSADAGYYGGHYGGHHTSFYGHGYSYGHSYHRPVVVTYPHVDLLSDGHGHFYFVDSHGHRQICRRTAYTNRYYYLNHGVRSYVLGY